MSMRMLIDARHREETRVAVVKGNRIEEFDFESAEHKQLKGNIYLAKVTRVEPSLQAAFIDYGGNRHGFLAFSEIHPDYYQIPKADRDALLREEAEQAAEEEKLRYAEADRREAADEDPDDAEQPDDEGYEAALEIDNGDNGENGSEVVESVEAGTGSNRSPVDESAADELRQKRQNLRRRYKIQDVIQRRQVLLVQVVKEERGNKGAALTTYLSLAGRYCVLMPNTSHGGGISRKISNGADRKRLKSIMSDLNLPSTMGLIVRTAGLSRTKVEIKRDFDYLARLWDEIREKTLGSSAPVLVYRDSDLIKRAIRDLYNRDIDEVIVEGEDGYKAARGFMKLLMPSHVRRVQQHVEATPLFQRHGVEDQLSAMYQPLVQLKSGGYLVINPTEALVSIDINSGRSTREHNIEQTAFATNLEAAAEIARQLRLRDMAGLVVIDFIDMEQSSHVRKVEKAMKDALKNDRARIQIGRISSFGLMEMSRQRLRTGVLEASTKSCPHCEGSGLMRTASSSGLSALRIIEDEAARGKGDTILLRAGREAAIYLLNRKRAELADIESRYGVSVEATIDEAFEGAKMSVESSGERPEAPRQAAVRPAAVEADDEDEFDDEMEVEDEADDEEAEDQGEESAPAPRGRREERPDGRSEAQGEGGARKRRRRRRGGRGRRRPDGTTPGEDQVEVAGQSEQPVNDDQPVAEAQAEPEQQEEAGRGDEAGPKPRTRRRPKSKPASDAAAAASPATAPKAAEVEPDSSPMAERPINREPPVAETDAAPEPQPKKRTRRKKSDEPAVAESAPEPAPAPAPEPQAEPEAKAKPKRRTGKAKAAELEAAGAEPALPSADNDSADGDTAGDLRRGWWQRTFG